MVLHFNFPNSKLSARNHGDLKWYGLQCAYENIYGCGGVGNGETENFYFNGQAKAINKQDLPQPQSQCPFPAWPILSDVKVQILLAIV